MNMRIFAGTVLLTVFHVFAAGTAVIAQEHAAVSFSGRVVDESGKGLGGAYIFMYEYGLTESGTDFDRRMVRRITANKDGRFELTAAHAEALKRLKAVVLAAKLGHSIGWVSWDLRSDVEGTITLGRHGQLGGRIIDEAGNAIANAQVRAVLFRPRLDEDGREWGMDVFDWLVMPTDERGRFVFTNIPVDVQAEFMVSGQGRVNFFTGKQQRPDGQGQVGQFAAGQEGITILLPRGGIIAGQAVEEKTGRGVGGIKLRVLPERAYPAESKVLVTDKDGRFRFEGLAEGLYSIGLLEGIAEGGAWVTVGAKAQVAAGQITSGVMIELTPPGILEVEVRDESTGRGVADALVTVERVGDMGDMTFGRTDTTGIARIPLMGAQYVLRSVIAEGYRRIEGGETISIAEGQRHRLTAKLSALPKIRGVVRDSNRRVVSGAEVMVLSCSRAVRTDDRGAFELSYDPQDGERKLIFARDTEKNLAALKELSADRRTIDLVAQPAVIVRGRVMDPDGLVGIARTNVGICLIAGTGRMYLPIRATTDEAGRYEIGGLPAGQSYSISAWSGDHGAGEVEVAIPAGTVGEFDAKPIKAGVVVVSGKVIDESNQPVAEASVDLYDVVDKSTFPIKLAHAGRGTTDQYGQYQIERRRRRDVESSFVIAAAQGHSASCISHYAGGGRVETIILKPNPGRLAGYVVDSEGMAVPGAKVHAILSSFDVKWADLRLAAGSTELFTCETDEGGRFEFTGVPNDARAEFGVIAEGYPKTFTWTTEKQLKVEQFRSGENDIEIVVTRIGGLAGRVIDAATQQGVGGVKVYMSRRRKKGANPVVMWNAGRGTVVWSMMEGDNRVVVSDRNGRFSTQGLVPGVYWVFLDPYSNPDREWVSKKELVSVEEGVLGEVTLEAAQVGWIKVRVARQQDSIPVTSTNVRLKHIAGAGGEKVASNASNRILPVRTDATGMAMFNVPPGTFAVKSVAATDYVLLDTGGVVTVQADQIEEIDVKIGYESPVIRGICVDESDAPIVGAEVSFLPISEATVATDSDGAFSLAADKIEILEGMREFCIAAIHKQSGLGGIQRIKRGEKEACRIVLLPTKSARGRVVDKDARPLAGAMVSLDVSWNLLLGTPPHPDQVWVPYRQVASNSEGFFEVEGLVPSCYQLITATAETYGQHQKYILPKRAKMRPTLSPLIFSPEGKAVVFETGQDLLDLGDFVLTPLTLSISGILVDAMGYPIAGMDLSAEGPEQFPQELVKTDRKGRFRFDGLSEGVIELGTDPESVGVGVSATVQAGDQDIVLVLAPERRPPKFREWKPNPDFDGAIVEVRLVDAATGKAPAITGISVGFSQEKGNYFLRHVDKDGIVYACVGAGRLKLVTGKWPVYDNKTVWIDIEKGKRHEVEVQIVRRASISGRVVDGDGQPVVGARVEIKPVGSHCETIADGSFSLNWDSAKADEQGYMSYLCATDSRRGLCAVAEIPQTGNVGEIMLLAASEIEIRILGNQKVIKHVSVHVTLRGPGVDSGIPSMRLGEGHFKVKGAAPLWTGYTYHVLFLGVWPPTEVDIRPDELVPGQTKVVEIVLDK